jgi:hypothetical protein
VWSLPLLCAATLAEGQPEHVGWLSYGDGGAAWQTNKQQLQRFGNRISYNSFGLRSEPVSPLPAPGVLRVLCIGDSITYGGALTDQLQTYPYLLQRVLRGRVGDTVEVLNASAAGWALENEEGWLRENGMFGSRVVVLEVGTHDLFQPMASRSVVDGQLSFPSHAPYLALQQVLARYLAPRISPGIAVKDPGTDNASRDPKFARDSINRIVTMASLVRDGGGTPIVLQVEQQVVAATLLPY